MKLTDIENPLVMDSSKPIYVKTSFGMAKVVGYVPPINGYNSFDPELKINCPQYWLVLLDGDKPGYEKAIYDAEIINQYEIRR